MVSNLDAESKDPNLNFGGIFPKNSLFDGVYYSWQYWRGGKPLNQKKIKDDSSQQKKLVMTTEPSSKIHSRNINIS